MEVCSVRNSYLLNTINRETVMIAFPDSPRYLYNKGKETQAGIALQRIRGSQYNVEPELDEYYADKKKEEQVIIIALTCKCNKQVH